MTELAESWDLFDTKKAGALPKDLFFKCVRSCGRLYLQSEIEEASKDLPDPVTKQQFIDFMATPYSPPSENLLEVLQVFDSQDSGTLRLIEFSSVLTTLGEKMSDDEAARLCKELTPDAEGYLNIADLAAWLQEPVQMIAPDVDTLMKSLPPV